MHYLEFHFMVLEDKKRGLMPLACFTVFLLLLCPVEAEPTKYLGIFNIA